VAARSAVTCPCADPSERRTTEAASTALSDAQHAAAAAAPAADGVSEGLRDRAEAAVARITVQAGIAAVAARTSNGVPVHCIGELGVATITAVSGHEPAIAAVAAATRIGGAVACFTGDARTATSATCAAVTADRRRAAPASGSALGASIGERNACVTAAAPIAVDGGSAVASRARRSSDWPEGCLARAAHSTVAVGGTAAVAAVARSGRPQA
jgi:hypothetical protein